MGLIFGLIVGYLIKAYQKEIVIIVKGLINK